MYFTMNIEGRRRRGYLEKKCPRQLDSPKNQSERQAMLKTISGSIWDRCWVHFGTQNGSNIALNFKSKIETPKSRPKMAQEAKLQYLTFVQLGLWGPLGGRGVQLITLTSDLTRQWADGPANSGVTGTLCHGTDHSQASAFSLTRYL